MSNDCPWQAYYFGRGATPDAPFTWTYHFFWGLEDVTANFVSMWDALETNKKVGEMWPNDADGLAWADAKTGQPPMLKEAGYTVVDGGRFQNGTEDYTPQISKFKAAGCELVSGVFIPPDFTNFWKQCIQQGFNPMVASIGKALLFPSALEALGDIGYGLHHRVLVVSQPPVQVVPDRTDLPGVRRRVHESPLTSSGPSRSCTTRSSRSSPTRSSAPRTSTTSRSSSTRSRPPTSTPSAATSTGRPARRRTRSPNVSKTPLVGGQWVKGEEWPFDLKIVTNVTADMVPVQQDVAPIEY